MRWHVHGYITTGHNTVLADVTYTVEADNDEDAQNWARALVGQGLGLDVTEIEADPADCFDAGDFVGGGQ